MSELANYRLYELACQIIIASGYVSSYEVLKYTAIFLTIKKNRLYIDHIQDALGRKRKIDCPLILFSGVIYFGKRKKTLRMSRFVLSCSERNHKLSL